MKKVIFEIRVEALNETMGRTHYYFDTFGELVDWLLND